MNNSLWARRPERPLRAQPASAAGGADRPRAVAPANQSADKSRLVRVTGGRSPERPLRSSADFRPAATCMTASRLKAVVSVSGR